MEIKIREYTAADLPLMDEWWAAHGEGAFPVALLPPVGVIAERHGEPLAACWLYMAVGVGVCWLEYPVSKSGLSMREAREAFEVVVAGLEAIARQHDYGVMLAHTLPPIARILHGLGFKSETRTKVTVGKTLR